jgi:hypothetical protein
MTYLSQRRPQTTYLVPQRARRLSKRGSIPQLVAAQFRKLLGVTALGVRVPLLPITLQSMGINSNKKRGVQLGVPYGTACNRLRRMVMFELLKKCGETTCFKCYKPILSWKDVSIEHKENWLDKDPALFWSMENISFSHLKCNRPHTYGNRYKKVGPEGTSWCCGCQEFLATDNFGRASQTHSGFRHLCNKCRKVRG